MSLIASNVAPRFVLDDLRLSAEIIDTSGRQRMYSQRILLLSSYLTTRPKNALDYRARLSSTADDMRDSQTQLFQYYTENIEPKLDDTPEGRAIKAEFASLNTDIMSFTTQAQTFASQEFISPNAPALRAFIDNNIDNELDRLDIAVQRYEAYALNQVRRIENIADFFLILALIVIALEALLIFLPAHKTIVRFVDERVEFEKRLSAQNAELEHFTYIASHDLRAPIRGMGDLVKWIEEDTDQNKDPNLEKKFTLLKNRVQRLDTLLSDMLAFSKIGKTEEKIEELNIADLVHEVSTWLTLPDGFDIKISNALPTLRGPRSTMRQIFFNLISNAVKHHDHEDGQVEISYQPSHSHHIFDIKDDGPGIPEKYKDYVFQVFSRLKPRDEVEGSGIGLSIVKRMAEAMDGHISSIDTADRGTTMRLTLPKIPA